MRARAICTLLLAAAMVLAIGVSDAGAFIYWADSQNATIGRAENDGSRPDDSFIHTGQIPIAVAVDGSHIYWASAIEHSIGRANIDGSGVDNHFISGLAEPSGVAVNAKSIFWSDFSVSGGIGRADLNGSNKEPKFVEGTGGSCGIALDGGHIYWTTPLLGEPAYIGRAGLAGTVEDSSFVEITGGIAVCGITVTPASIFWAEPGIFGPNGTRIGRANTVDGKGLDKSFIAGSSGPCGLAVDGSSHLYWANAGTNTIGRANTDGTSVNQSFVATGANEPCGVAVDGLSSPPAPPPPSDTKPPQTKIVKGPGKKLARGMAKFSFSASEAGSTFACKLDAKKAAPCRSPKRYRHLKPGRHTFKVWATDTAGNRDLTPAKRSFRVPGR